MGIQNYSVTPASNTTINGINIAEGCNASNINDAIRQLMADTALWDIAPLAVVAGGTADALTVTLAPAPTALTDGMTVQVRAGVNPNATTTPTLSLNGLGVAGTIVKQGRQALAAGDIAANMELQLRYIAATNQWELMNTKLSGGTLTSTTTMSGAAFNETEVSIALTGVAGQTPAVGAAPANTVILGTTGGGTVTGFDNGIAAGVQRIVIFGVATTLVHSSTFNLPGAANITTANADRSIWESRGSNTWYCVAYIPASGGVVTPASAATTLAGTDNALALTAAGFAGNKSLGASGYYKLPGGLIVQWGSASVAGSSQSTITFPTAFPTACDTVVVSWNDTSAGGVSMPATSAGAGTITTTNFVLANGAGAVHTIGWVAIGR
jgi:hypothetical protein